VEYWALTPTVPLDIDPEQGNRLPLTPDTFQDMDYRPLAGLWADIVAQEEQAAAAAVAAGMSTLVVPPNVPTLVQPTTVPTPELATTSALKAEMVKPLFTVVATTLSRTVTTMGAALPAPIPLAVDQATVDRPDIPVVSDMVAGGGPRGSPLTTSASQTDRRPILHLADVAYAVRVSQIGQADRIADTLLRHFQTVRTRDQLLQIIQCMSAMLHDVGSFLRERVVLAQLSDEPLQEVLDDITRLLAHYMASEASQYPA